MYHLSRPKKSPLNKSLLKRYLYRPGSRAPKKKFPCRRGTRAWKPSPPNNSPGRAPIRHGNPNPHPGNPEPLSSQPAPAPAWTDPNAPRPKPGTPEYEAMVQRAIEEQRRKREQQGQG